MLKVVTSFANDILWPEFTQLADALMEYLDETIERIIREEICKDTGDPSEF
jgi:hypothetical protein